MERCKQFMELPLVAWIKLFDDIGAIENVEDIADGVIFHKIMNAVDSNTYGMTRVNRTVNNDISLRLHNLQLAVNCVVHFYLTSQQQLVLTSLPDISCIAHEPTSDKSLDELERFMILLLGCAIQSDNKENLIEQMKSMNVETQQALIFYIQKITETTEFVCSLDWNDLGDIAKTDLEALCRTAYVHMQRVAKERDTLFDTLIDTVQERDFYMKEQQAAQDNDSIYKPSPSPQINPEVIELKKQVRNLQEDIDHKTDVITDQSQQLEQAKTALQKLHTEKKELMDDAKTARAYRDELETLKVQSSKIEKLESDIIKYRQRAEDADYLKKRIIELKQQNELMQETKTLLEQKVLSLTSRAESVDELQVEVASYKVQIDALNQEKQMDMERIEELVTQTARLELENKSNQEQISQLLSELETERERMSAVGVVSTSTSEGSLGFEMSEADMAQRAKLNRLEKETREMEKSMEALRHAQAKVSELEKTNKKLYSQSHSDRKEIIKLREEVEMLKVKASRVDKLQIELSSQREKLEEGSRLQSRLKELKSRNEQIMEAKAMLEDEVENLQGKVTLLENLRSEVAQSRAQIDSLNSEHIEDQSRVKELLEQNAQLELEKQKLTDEIETLIEQSKNASGSSKVVITPSRVSETEMVAKAKLQRLEKETKDMEQTMESLRHSQAKVTELERSNKKLNEKLHGNMREMIKLKEEIQGYKSKASRLERKQSTVKLSESDKNQEVEAAQGKIAELKQQNILLSEAKISLEEELNNFQSKLSKLGELQGENAALKVRVSSLEEEKVEDNQRMEGLLQENAQLELERDRNLNDIDVLKTELDKLRTSAVTGSNNEPSSPVRQLLTETELANRAKLIRLERDHRDLQRSYELYKQRTEKATSEVEKSNKKLNTQLHNDRKEIVRLKEELKHEKEVATKLTKQVQHLQKISTPTASPNGSHHVVEQKKIEELGTKFDEALSHSLSIKEERITQLEARLADVIKENRTLREDLLGMKRISSQSNGPTTPTRSVDQSSQEMIRMKEKNAQLMASITDYKHIIKQQQLKINTLQERQEMLDQLNQTLEEEKKTLLLQVNKLLEQNQSLLLRTLESKDQELEEERIFSDRLEELEKDKARLSEQLIHQQKESMAREISFLKKSNREKNKSLFKKGLKKLKGKLQLRTTYTLPDAEAVGTASTSTSFSPHRKTLPAVYRVGDGSSVSSNQSISSNSHHSDSHEDLDPLGSAPDINQFLPRGPLLAGNSPVTLRKRKTQSMIVPSSHDGPSIGSSAVTPFMLPEKQSDVMSLEEFLAETNKTPNRRKLMEIKRASFITPPVTPRGSMYFNSLGVSNTPLFDQADIQDFLRKLQKSDDTLSIPEVDEPDLNALDDDAASQKSYDTSGSTTQEEETEASVNANNNNNNNNNNICTSYSVTASETSQEQDTTIQCCKNLHESADNINDPPATQSVTSSSNYGQPHLLKGEVPGRKGHTSSIVSVHYV